MNLKQLDHEHVTQSWEIEDEVNDNKLPYSWFKFMDDNTNFLCWMNFASRNLLDSAVGGTFM